VLLIDHDEPQPRQAGKTAMRVPSTMRAAGVRRQPAFQALRVGHAAVQADHGRVAIQRRKALAKRASSWGVRLISGTITSAWAAGLAASACCTLCR
jgi:hypothetical protein